MRYAAQTAACLTSSGWFLGTENMRLNASAEATLILPSGPLDPGRIVSVESFWEILLGNSVRSCHQGMVTTLPAVQLEIVSLLEKFSWPGGDASASRSRISRPLT